MHYAYLVSDEGVADTDNLGIAELIRRAIEKLRGERKQKIPLKIKQLELLQFNGAAVIRQIRIK